MSRVVSVAGSLKGPGSVATTSCAPIAVHLRPPSTVVSTQPIGLRPTCWTSSAMPSEGDRNCRATTCGAGIASEGCAAAADGTAPTEEGGAAVVTLTGGPGPRTATTTPAATATTVATAAAALNRARRPGPGDGAQRPDRQVRSVRGRRPAAGPPDRRSPKLLDGGRLTAQTGDGLRGQHPHGALPDPKDPCRLRRREVLVVARDQHGTLAGRQASDGRSEAVGVVHPPS